MTDDELEHRKEETWGMDEVRGGSLAQKDTEAISHGENPSDTTDTEDITEAEAATEADAVPDIAAGKNEGSGSDTTDTAQPENPADASDTEDTTDPEITTGRSAPQDSSDASDTLDGDAPSVSKERVKGDTVRQMALNAEDEGLTVRDLRNVNVYLYDDIHQEMVSMFKALDAEYYQTHGEDLSKNKDFFNAVFRAGLNSPRLREELELEEE